MRTGKGLLRLACIGAAGLLLLSCEGREAPVGGADAVSARAREADAVSRAKEREGAGDRAGAEAAWEEVLALHPGQATALYSTARLRRARGDLGGALERIEALRIADPGAGRAGLLAAEILSDPAAGTLRDLGRAETLAREALARNPEESGPQLVLGRVLLLGGKGPEAAERLALAARMNPRDSESRSLLGVLALRGGEAAGARRWFRECLRGAAPAGAAASPGGVPGEGDTAASLDPGRPPTGGELRAVAGLAALGESVGGVGAGESGPGVLGAARAALEARGTGEALLDLDGDGVQDGAAVLDAGGGVSLAVRRGRETLLVAARRE